MVTKNQVAALLPLPLPSVSLPAPLHCSSLVSFSHSHTFSCRHLRTYFLLDIGERERWSLPVKDSEIDSFLPSVINAFIYYLTCFIQLPCKVDVPEKENWLWRGCGLLSLLWEDVNSKSHLFPYKCCCPTISKLSAVPSLTTFCQHSAAFETVSEKEGLYPPESYLCALPPPPLLLNSFPLYLNSHTAVSPHSASPLNLHKPLPNSKINLLIFILFSLPICSIFPPCSSTSRTYSVHHWSHSP